jgi:hypothetical protein
MIITWTKYLARRKIALEDVTKAYGYNYAQLSSYFLKLGVTPPDRDEPQVIEIFGPPVKAPVPATKKLFHAPVTQARPPRKKVEVSMKDTKKALLDLALSLSLDVTEKMTKSNILNILSATGKVNVTQVKVARKNNKG